ncbi:MAG: transcription-repair coupling factor [Candidatus Faecousia sp.]|nr:transcription-repair coupling factor [Bacillota bacterium]MDY4219076.1 transcription-repair coupling factor [Candidatus Faecousia sp.]
MDLLLSALKALPGFRRLADTVEEGGAAAATGLAQINRSHVIAGLYAGSSRPMAVICQDDLAAKRLREELKDFLHLEAPVLPSRDLNLYDAAVTSRVWEQRRLGQLYALAKGETRLQIFSWESMCMRTMPREVLLRASFRLRLGESLDISELTARLISMGYSRCSMVEGPGQFALRGGILDLYSPGEGSPVRAEFFGNELDTMGFFDPDTQRRTENVSEITVLPVAETQPGLHPRGTEGLARDLEKLIARQRRRKNPNEALIHTLEQDVEKLQNGVTLPAADRYLSLIYPEPATALDYLSRDTVLVVCDQGSLRRSAHRRTEELGLQLDSLLPTGAVAGELCDFDLQWEDFCRGLAGRPVAYLDAFAGAAYPEERPPQELLTFTAKQLPGYGGSLETAASDLGHYQKMDFSCLVLCGSRRRAELLQTMLSEKGLSGFLAFPLTSLPKPGQILLAEGILPSGMEYPDIKLAVLSEGQLMARETPKPKAKKSGSTNRQKLASFTDLSPGDLVVHDQYGIGRFVSMEQIRVDGAVKDYVKIAYQGSDTLYVPATQLDLISKYIGGGEDAPVKLNKIGTDAWQRTKAKARKAAKDMAGELIKLYAARKGQTGYAFAADSPWQREFEDNFPYPETDDQLRCIGEIKGDMESPVPMDRLLCGDVGFGKTEVALRAVMKAVLDSKQVAILVPTTVLAQQHYQTVVGRFRGFPVNVDVLSRFRTPAQQKRTLQNLRAGTVDIIIGTHKLLQKSVQFKDLGLLVVDEEQRFGVSHKERLKEISKGVDVLTLSATPIPRTLNMALSGIRDMSTIEVPPADRYPVQTFVMEHNQGILDDAIRRELQRGGQVYYLHNRVETIDRCAAGLRQRLGAEVSIAVAHGQMGEEALGDVMQAMADGQVQVLVCTTIIETGLDIPNANTLIIENADRMGLSQLHQLRGRVGRSSRHAFAYFTYKPDKSLSEVAEKRLTAIRDFAEFGSGFKIAMRDLEIRGAGNLLGAEQSGHMMSVGYDMYLKLLDEAVREEQGKAPAEPECTADLNVTANIDKAYVERGEERMDLYRRMAAIRNQEDADDLLDEIVDRYGEPPKGVLNLVDIALLRAMAQKVGVCDIRQKGAELNVTLTGLDFQKISQVCAAPQYKNRLFLAADAKKPTLRLTLPKGADPLRQARSLVEQLGAQ